MRIEPESLSLSLLEGPSGSDAAQLDCDNRTGKERRNQIERFKFGK